MIEKANQMKIGIAGCGGIGSNVGRFLAQAGFYNLCLVDFDKIEKSNLNRQFFKHSEIGQLKASQLAHNLSEIVPEAASFIQSHNIKIDKGNVAELFGDCDVVVEALDNKETKAMLLEGLAVRFPNLPIVAVSGIAGMDCEKITSKKIGKLTIVGDFVSDTDGNELYGYKVSAVCARVTQKVILALMQISGGLNE